MNMPLDDIADPFSEAGVRARARGGLLAAPSDAIFDPRSGRALGPSDWDLNPEFVDDLAVMAPPRPAAVLIPIVLRETLSVMLTQRAHDMPSHPGQISFPGGKVEKVDATPVDCALREAHEEVGLDPAAVELIGELGHLNTVVSRSYIVPIVGRLATTMPLHPASREVERVLWLPLAELVRPDTYRSERWGRTPTDRLLHFFELDDETVWGATAHILVDLLNRLR